MNDSLPWEQKKTWEQKTESAEVSPEGTPEVHDPSAENKLPSVQEMSEAQSGTQEVAPEAVSEPQATEVKTEERTEVTTTEVTPEEPKFSQPEQTQSDSSESSDEGQDAGDSSEGSDES